MAPNYPKICRRLILFGLISRGVGVYLELLRPFGRAPNYREMGGSARLYIRARRMGP